jgi:hypothetical protein
LIPKHGTATDELDAVIGIEFTEGQQRTGDRSGRGEVASHSIQRDSRQGQPSFAAIRCLPA